MRNKVAVALVIAAVGVFDDSANFPSTTADATVIANRENLALEILEDTGGWAKYTWKLLIADNNTASIAAIQGASDATIQTKVNNLFDVMAKAHAANQSIGA